MKIYINEECIKTNIKLKIRFLKLILLFLRSLYKVVKCPIWVRSPLPTKSLGTRERSLCKKWIFATFPKIQFLTEESIFLKKSFR